MNTVYNLAAWWSLHRLFMARLIKLSGTCLPDSHTPVSTPAIRHTPTQTHKEEEREAEWLQARWRQKWRA